MSDREDAREKILNAAAKMLSIPLKLAPTFLGAVWVGGVIGSVVDSHPYFKERLSELEGKLFLFEATDIGKKIFLEVRDNSIHAVAHTSATPDVVMRGDVRVLLELFLGRVDPDTVFFSRRLEINGDTAAAILLKNLLAGL